MPRQDDFLMFKQNVKKNLPNLISPTDDASEKALRRK